MIPIACLLRECRNLAHAPRSCRFHVCSAPMRGTLLCSAILFASCGPGSRDHDTGNGKGSDPTGDTKIVGRIWAPKWAPGDVPPGQEIPVFGATVWVTNTQPPPIPQQTFCDDCVDT